MEIWSKCDICGRDIPVGELCYGLKKGNCICKDCCTGFQNCTFTLAPAPTLTPPNEWVSVEERLPEPEFDWQQRGFYLVALSNGVVKELAYEFRHYENMIFDVGWHETAHPVTHWMSLPEPPAKES